MQSTGLFTVTTAMIASTDLKIIVTIQVQVQSPSPKSIDLTSYMEDRVILNKVLDVQLSSNSYSRLQKPRHIDSS